jgi:hypothetical protein
MSDMGTPLSAIEWLRWIFGFILTPLAVCAVLGILASGVAKTIIRGFREDVREGYQRICAAVLPFAVMLYAVVREHTLNGGGWLDLNKFITGCAPWQLFVASVVVGVGLAAEVFHNKPNHRLLMRALGFALSGVACFIGYVFLGVASTPGIDIALGVLVGFCGYSVFPNKLRGPETEAPDDSEEDTRRRLQCGAASGSDTEGQ